MMKWTERTLVLVTVVLVIGSYSTNAQATDNLLVNGSFEQGPSLGSDDTRLLSSGATDITGWLVTQGNIDIVGQGYWQPSDGLRSLDLNGVNSSGGIGQTFSTVSGQQYRVVFDMAGNPTGGPSVKSMRVQAAGQSEGLSFNTSGHSTSNMGWLTVEWDFVATGNTTTLEFISLDAASNFGPALDNVIVTPEPATLGLLLIGGLALLRHRRK